MKELCLTIPCEPGKPGGIEPIHIFVGNDSTGAAMTRWQCPHCKLVFYRRKPATKHMGLIMNIPAGCPVLVAQDDERRKSLRKWLDETREAVDSDSLSDGLFFLREQEKINRQD
jgi:hypothetical protein